MSEVLANGQLLASMLPYFSELELGVVKMGFISFSSSLELNDRGNSGIKLFHWLEK